MCRRATVISSRRGGHRGPQVRRLPRLPEREQLRPRDVRQRGAPRRGGGHPRRHGPWARGHARAARTAPWGDEGRGPGRTGLTITGAAPHRRGAGSVRSNRASRADVARAAAEVLTRQPRDEADARARAVAPWDAWRDERDRAPARRDDPAVRERHVEDRAQRQDASDRERAVADEVAERVRDQAVAVAVEAPDHVRA